MKTAIVSCATYRHTSEKQYHAQPVHSVYSVTCEVKEAPLWWHDKGLSFTASGYGSRIPTRYMVRFNGRWRRVYCRQYSNTGTLYIGKLSEYGERTIVSEGDC